MKTLPVQVQYNEAEIINSTQEAQADLAFARKLKIVDDTGFAQWAEDAKEIARQIKATKLAKDTVLAPLQAAVTAVNALFKPREDAYNALNALIRGELERYGLAKKTEARAQMKAAGEAANRGDTDGVAVALTRVSAAAPDKSLGVTIREVWSAEVVAPNMVPREWCIPDEKRINKLARETPAGRVPCGIPGVRFTLVGSSTVRSKL